MKPIVIDLGRVTVELREERELTGGGYGARWETVGSKSGAVTLTIDVDRLMRQHARKTLKNTSGRATLSDGAIVFQVDKKSIQEDRS